MKKIILLVLINLFIIPVNAKTYYGPYSEYSSYSEEFKESSDTVDVIEKKVYRAYEENVIYEYLENHPTGIKTGQTKLVLGEKTTIKPEHVFEENTLYTYLKQSENAKIKIKNNFGTSIYIEDIIINGKSQNKCHFLTNAYSYALTFEKNSNEYLISIKTEHKENYSLTFSLIYDKQERIIGTITNDNESLLIDESIIFYDEEETETEDKESIIGKYIGEKTYYIPSYIYYEYMITNINYLDLYLEDSLEYKLDYNDSKTLYSFRTREKIEVDDNLYIDSKDINLMDFISSNCDVKFTSNINYSINGIYKVNYITPFKTISKDVTVDIKENYINLIKAQEKALKDLQDKHDEAVYKVNLKNQEIKEVINSSDDEYINNEYIKCKDKLNDEKENKTDLKTVKVKAKKSSIIIVLFLIIGYIYLFLSKKVER